MLGQRQCGETVTGRLYGSAGLAALYGLHNRWAGVHMTWPRSEAAPGVRFPAQSPSPRPGGEAASSHSIKHNKGFSASLGNKKDQL